MKISEIWQMEYSLPERLRELKKLELGKEYHLHVKKVFMSIVLKDGASVDVMLMISIEV